MKMSCERVEIASPSISSQSEDGKTLLGRTQSLLHLAMEMVCETTQFE
jgi:hypothetical protein